VLYTVSKDGAVFLWKFEPQSQADVDAAVNARVTTVTGSKDAFRKKPKPFNWADRPAKAALTPASTSADAEHADGDEGSPSEDSPDSGEGSGSDGEAPLAEGNIEHRRLKRSMRPNALAWLHGDKQRRRLPPLATGKFHIFTKHYFKQEHAKVELRCPLPVHACRCIAWLCIEHPRRRRGPCRASPPAAHRLASSCLWSASPPASSACTSTPEQPCTTSTLTIACRQCKFIAAAVQIRHAKLQPGPLAVDLQAAHRHSGPQWLGSAAAAAALGRVEALPGEWLAFGSSGLGQLLVWEWRSETCACWCRHCFRSQCLQTF
jgi:hypothetical protein